MTVEAMAIRVRPSTTQPTVSTRVPDPKKALPVPTVAATASHSGAPRLRRLSRDRGCPRMPEDRRMLPSAKRFAREP